jgi:phospholipid/cholesterol/gamma-HCH transport system permease protein
MMTTGLSFVRNDDGVLVVSVAGRWRMREGVPAADTVLRALAERPPLRVVYDDRGLDDWDATLLSFVRRIADACRELHVPVDTAGLPAGARRLLEMAARSPASMIPAAMPSGSWLDRIGRRVLDARGAIVDILAFVGGLVVASARLATGRGHARRRDFFVQVQLAGSQALPIVGLVCFLVGLILAFVAAIQLRRFGTEIYVADLVGVGMVRELGAVMAAIVVAGRTGAAFAAEIGTMRVTQELDALDVVGIPPMEILVVPRVVALALMLPLLTIYADVLGILGGGVVGVGMLHIPASLYYRETIAALTVGQFGGGLLKALVYGALVGCAGCFAGLRAGSSAAAVGRATTSAVVSSIVLVIGACGVFALVFYVLGW